MTRDNSIINHARANVNEKTSFKGGMLTFKYYRLLANLTQKQVADALGIDQTTVHLWEAGKTKPRAALLIRLAALYNCTIDELLSDKEE